MFLIKQVAALLVLSMASANINVRRGGWLDRVVIYIKNRFYKDVEQLPAVEIKATIEPAPEGYVDSKLWDINSVLHLLTLIEKSESAAPVRRALRKEFRPSRRVSLAKTHKLFPSLAKDHLNEFYYSEAESDEYFHDNSTVADLELSDTAVIYVSNPVESRLPSARISVKLLREILESRAEAARPISKPTGFIKWKTTVASKSTTTKGNDKMGLYTKLTLKVTGKSRWNDIGGKDSRGEEDKKNNLKGGGEKDKKDNLKGGGKDSGKDIEKDTGKDEKKGGEEGGEKEGEKSKDKEGEKGGEGVGKEDGEGVGMEGEEGGEGGENREEGGKGVGKEGGEGGEGGEGREGEEEGEKDGEKGGEEVGEDGNKKDKPKHKKDQLQNSVL